MLPFRAAQIPPSPPSPPTPPSPMRLAILMPSFGDGGVERMLVNLAGGLAGLGVEVDFLTRSRTEPYLDQLDPRVRLVETRHSGVLDIQPFMRRYLHHTRPDFVLCGKDRAGRAAVLARRLSGVPFQLVMRPGTSALNEKQLTSHVEPLSPASSPSPVDPRTDGPPGVTSWKWLSSNVLTR